MQQLEINTAIQISRSKTAIFEAIVHAEKMSGYFISSSSGSLQEGKTIRWTFPEFPDSFPVKVVQVNASEKVIFEWDGAEGFKTTVKISLEKITGTQTLVRVTEGKMEVTEQGITWYGRNTEGWANFLASLKAYMEHGINLRKGAFDYLKK
ncbi:SRPBCC domain-containing protein [Salinimicrobium sp. TH3]|uniref:SRPBCC domain-containing protein n=1 Tax=Salinimicrobium sp. TH3 TaxID=2997342 RepID=UPI002275E279|nr:SRPBCC domain-containing protein [Salinimicrobium sp. TH3]MCY2685841.1 SRPBCC domain-containing protein [Salinimicrobium sp. TH3]